jgi:hypothetical protein
MFKKKFGHKVCTQIVISLMFVNMLDKTHDG